MAAFDSGNNHMNAVYVIKYSLKMVISQDMRIHSGIKPHACNVCNKRFSQRHHLTRHLKVHSGLEEHQV